MTKGRLGGQARKLRGRSGQIRLRRRGRDRGNTPSPWRHPATLVKSGDRTYCCPGNVDPRHWGNSPLLYQSQCDPARGPPWPRRQRTMALAGLGQAPRGPVVLAPPACPRGLLAAFQSAAELRHPPHGASCLIGPRGARQTPTIGTPLGGDPFVATVSQTRRNLLRSNNGTRRIQLVWRPAATY